MRVVQPIRILQSDDFNKDKKARHIIAAPLLIGVKYMSIIGIFPHGEKGTAGVDGKSAYKAAQDGGFSGTEEQFNSALSTVAGKADMPKYYSVTLSSDGWSDNEQTVLVSAIEEDETKQLIFPVPAATSQAAYYDAGVKVTNQSAGSLTFTAETAPEDSLTVYVVVIEVQQ